ncbi:c-type cytochrome biogenesis protein CcmI [Mixta theicola]|uniref:C-type cytochrome biogenesis protein CcmI n=1 Tax=Mixta theicola TaxID=1458355 RepID=A0A2K1Q5W7_9GAMM|nr:c-type cytochrome biogenesis protein CcmI [Mixta theicola]PNS10398.1 c-type cytochrome biogenesis protein CcmI [Mixta theicola]GLR10617.1 c-type cytochrome biogenesis protein CcmI [Mixta theicola]
MTLFWITLTGLLLAALLLLLTAGWRSDRQSPVDRDTLNKIFYRQRLNELDQDEAQGVIAARQPMVQELQQTLLTDIPTSSSPTPARPLSRWALLPGALLLVAISLGCYLKTGGLPGLIAWQQVQDDYPTLRARLLDPQAKPLTLEELARLGLGLRTALQQDGSQLHDWLILGRIGMVLNNRDTAIEAFQRALQLAPDNEEIKLSYAEVLTRSSDPQDNREAQAMLNAMQRHDPANLRLLSLVAFNAFEQQQYPRAIEAWQTMLTQLPTNDPRIAQVQRSIQQAKTAAGLQSSQLSLSITLAAPVEKMLPPDGVMYISVSDGVSPVPVAVKKLPLSHFPLSLTLDDSNAMMPDRLLSAQHQVKVRVRIARDGSATPRSGDWFGESALTPFDGHQHLTVEINQQQP